MARLRGATPLLAPIKVMESAAFAADQIRNEIIAGRYKPGDRLTEKALTDQLGISRHPVREALRMLTREGFVDIRLNRGAVVAMLNEATILETYELRSALGAIALRHVLTDDRRFKEIGTARLDRFARDALAFADLDDQNASIRNDLEFQDAIVEASGAERTIRYFKELTAEIRRFNNLSGIVYTNRSDDARKYVAGLATAIRNRDLAEAHAIWSEKFRVAMDRFIARLRQKQVE